VDEIDSGREHDLYIGSHYEVSGGVATLFIFAGNTRIAQIKGVNTNYFHKDHLGSSTKMSNNLGAGVETTEYMPFGPMREHAGTTISNYKYTDQELDPETGLYFYGARYYDPIIGRFISADSIVPNFADPQSLNRYGYCRNNPLIYTDPSGHWFGIDDLISAVVGAVIGAVSAAVNGDNILKGAAIGAAAAWVGWNTFGAATGALAEAIVGTTEAAYVANGGLFWIAQVGGGIAGGAAGGATASMLNGGDVGQSALTGGIIGGLGSLGLPNFAPFGDSAAGSIGNRLVNTSLTGAGFGAAYAGLTGGDIGHGAASGALGWAAGEAGNMLIGHGLGLAMSGKGPKYKNGAFYYYPKGQGPFTVGGVIIGDKGMLAMSYYINGQQYSVDQHERAHFPQDVALSVSYIPVHLISQGVSGIVGSFTGAKFWDSTHRYNIFERWWIDVPSY
jgi:RHS repeat-associated protein